MKIFKPENLKTLNLKPSIKKCCILENRIKKILLSNNYKGEYKKLIPLFKEIILNGYISRDFKIFIYKPKTLLKKGFQLKVFRILNHPQITIKTKMKGVFDDTKIYPYVMENKKILKGGLNEMENKRFCCDIESDIKNIFFNKDNKNKSLAIKNLIPLFKELVLNGYLAGITQEYLLNLLDSDERKKDKNALSRRIALIVKRLNLKKNKVYKYSKTTEILKYSVVVPIYERDYITTIKNLYPTITEKTTTQEKNFKYKGDKKVLIGQEIKPLIREQITEILI